VKIRSASRPTSDGARDSGGWRGTRRAQEGTRAGAQPRARGRTRPEIDASAILNSPQSASRPENPPCTGLPACPTRRPKAEGSSAGPLSWRRSRNRAFMAAITWACAAFYQPLHGGRTDTAATCHYHHLAAQSAHRRFLCMLLLPQSTQYTLAGYNRLRFQLHLSRTSLWASASTTHRFPFWSTR
jgi:hypothetical protein